MDEAERVWAYEGYVAEAGKPTQYNRLSTMTKFCWQAVPIGWMQ